jgi:hypothetical protein
VEHKLPNYQVDFFGRGESSLDGEMHRRGLLSSDHILVDAHSFDNGRVTGYCHFPLGLAAANLAASQSRNQQSQPCESEEHVFFDFDDAKLNQKKKILATSEGSSIQFEGTHKLNASK